MPVSEAFKKRINYLADETYLTKSQLRLKIGISNSSFFSATVYGIVPTTKILVKIADYFEVSVNYLLGKTSENDFIKSDSDETFHDRFVALCNEKNLSFYKVGHDCGIDDSLILHWLRHKFIPMIDTLEILSDYFGVSPDYLLGRSDFRI